MKTLILTKQHTGIYSNKIDNIEVCVSICTKGWEGTITDDNSEDFVIFKAFANTKKEVIEILTKHIINNF